MELEKAFLHKCYRAYLEASEHGTQGVFEENSFSLMHDLVVVPCVYNNIRTYEGITEVSNSVRALIPPSSSLSDWIMREFAFLWNPLLGYDGCEPWFYDVTRAIWLAAYLVWLCPLPGRVSIIEAAAGMLSGWGKVFFARTLPVTEKDYKHYISELRLPAYEHAKPMRFFHPTLQLLCSESFPSKGASKLFSPEPGKTRASVLGPVNAGHLLWRHYFFSCWLENLRESRDDLDKVETQALLGQLVSWHEGFAKDASWSAALAFGPDSKGRLPHTEPHGSLDSVVPAVRSFQEAIEELFTTEAFPSRSDVQALLGRIALAANSLASLGSKEILHNTAE